ncbi:Diadenosine 5',5'''-P1,P4-tetraphosphate phosphorylase 2 [Gracilariopsis chorda]|uniref:Diadenosine 5',5'''-P1,P4-tetraphosphate phosphorylase 2 n=1 Tax=Gracilariopsis chorda TaxID=448386 RepID=A0A2V3IIX7_9FLOR|nr:Diadenosine 5',5'''-P1,P4-tetraphosphate phosphorylase 2 [Gracilariopsis chorda]|eukprot:PXF42055.1 Diadenosine 5',5'''-P1,P4-tetraphosphate phosphorylase 2 [Gracilariopsis chorda]
MLARIRAVSAAALEQGALQPIETRYTVIPPRKAHEPAFVLRVLTNVARKQAESKKQARAKQSANEKAWNPFLPYDPAMYVQDVGDDHVLLLNKFNVVQNHALIVTKRFEEQNSLLTCSDMTALWICLGEMRGIAFYNAGKTAGASQRHKHLQIVPAPMVPHSDEDTPFEHAILKQVAHGTTYSSSALPYLHAIIRMDDCAKMASEGDLQGAARVCMQRYLQLLKTLEQGVQEAGEEQRGEEDEATSEEALGAESRQPFSYNVLVSRRWMMLIPRRKECFQDVSVNSMGFVGCLLVRDEASAQQVRNQGAMGVLSAVAVRAPARPPIESTA